MIEALCSPDGASCRYAFILMTPNAAWSYRNSTRLKINQAMRPSVCKRKSSRATGLGERGRLCFWPATSYLCELCAQGLMSERRGEQSYTHAA